MKKIEDYTLEEQKELSELLETWLCYYTPEIIKKAMANINEIVSNENAMYLLRELNVRTKKERQKRKDCFKNYLFLFKDNDLSHLDLIHCNPLEHASSYRDVLFDMFIKEKD